MVLLQTPRALATLGAAFLAPLTVTAAPNLCTAEEQVLFACRVGARRAAVCASADLGASTGTVQYRYGRPGAVPELAHPAVGSDWRALTRADTFTFSGGGGAVLAFDKPPYRYAVYTALGRGWGSKAGVVVEKAGRRIASLRCDGKAVSELGSDLFTRTGIMVLDGGFELP